MSSRFASGKKAQAICDRCGQTVKLRELRDEIVKGRDSHIKVCRACFDPDHPQLMLGEFPVNDPQALEYPRPDMAEFPSSRAQIVQLSSMRTSGLSGQPQVAIS